MFRLLIFFSCLVSVRSKNDLAPASASSLVFVFDVTGSMSSELDQVKRGASKILKTISESEEKIIANYIFVPFGDPNIGPVVATTNTTEFRDILRELTVEGGGDCPEMSLGGIKKSLEISLPNSYVYVFTDAHPKDSYLLDDVLALIQKKNSQIIFVLTGNCDDGLDPEEFVKIVAVSTGQIFDLIKNDVHQVLEFIRLSLGFRRVNLLAVDSANSTIATKTYDVPVDETIRELTFSLAGRKTRIDIVDSSGKRLNASSDGHLLLNLENIKIISVLNPKPGLWKINVTSVSAYYTLRTTGQSSFSFVHGFSVEWVSSINETSYWPLKDLKNYIFVTPKNLTYAINFTLCEIVMLNGTVINTVWLKKADSIYGLFYGSFVPNNTNFHLQISGVTANGTVIRRISASAVSSQSAKSVVVTLPSEQIIRAGENYTMKCHVESLVPFEAYWLKEEQLLHISQRFRDSAVFIYQITNATVSVAGNYTCVAKLANQTVKAYTNLQVIGAPTIIQQSAPSRIVVKANDDYAIPCAAVGYPEPTIKWTLNYTVQINENAYKDEIITLPDKTLVFVSFASEHSGIYSCLAENQAGTDRRHYEIIVIDEKPVLDNVSHVKVVETEKAVLRCPVLKPSIQIQWLKDNQPLDMTSNERADEPRYVLSKNNSVLKILETRSTDSGLYACTISYLYETAEFRFLLEIQIPPYFPELVETSIQVSVRENEIITFNCNVDGYPVPKIMWRKSDFSWPVNRWTLSNVALSYPDRQVLTILEFRRDIHLGNYTCFAKNELSSTDRSFSVETRD